MPEARRCELCEVEPAVHEQPNDWKLCEKCFRKRWRARVCALAVAFVVLVALLQSWQSCVVRPAN